MGTKVLIVDDAAFMRMMLRDILTKNGFEVVGEADNGKNAVQMYSELKPDVVTMDITMPDMDGIEATRRILAVHPGACIVIVTSHGQEQMVMDAIEAGAFGAPFYIVRETDQRFWGQDRLAFLDRHLARL